MTNYQADARSISRNGKYYYNSIQAQQMHRNTNMIETATDSTTNLMYNNAYWSYQLSQYICSLTALQFGAMLWEGYLSLNDFVLNQYKDISKFAKHVEVYQKHVEV